MEEDEKQEENKRRIKITGRRKWKRIRRTRRKQNTVTKGRKKKM